MPAHGISGVSLCIMNAGIPAPYLRYFMKSDILIVEDHKETCVLLSATLDEAGFSSYCAGTIAAAKKFLAQHDPRLIILDLHLPDGNGLKICSYVRANAGHENVPVIALTGQDSFQNKREGFHAGVDCYLTKPIDMAELVMWVEALLRRVDMDKRGGVFLTAYDLQLDSKSQLAKYKNKPVENLTRREFELLYALVKCNPGILTRKEIIEKVWRTAAVENLVDTHMFNLRKKLPCELSQKLQAVAGKGFRYLDKK